MDIGRQSRFFAVNGGKMISKLLKRYALLDPYGNPKSKNNQACFDSEENKNRFIDEMTKLRETPLDFCADVISVTESEIGSQLISGGTSKYSGAERPKFGDRNDSMPAIL